MTVRSIVPFPDPRLRQVAHTVTVFDGQLRLLAADITETMRLAPGIGMTASHIGVAQRVYVLELPGDVQPQTYVNPEITWLSDETAQNEEGSVSMPGVTELVTRPCRVTVRYQDINGNEQLEHADGLRAICHQHEIDQLNGLFWTQKLSSLRRNRLMARYKKLHTMKKVAEHT